jgi:colicin import membrane protein
MRAAACFAVAFAGFGVYEFVEALRPAHEPAKLEAPRAIVPTPPPRQSAVDEPRASPPAVAAPVSARHVDEAPAPAKPTPPARPIVVQRDPALESWFVKSYLRCWTPPSSLPQGEKYSAEIRVVHNTDGSLSGAPRLVNPPSDPDWRAYADSAVRAVAKCNPLQVPARYAPHFDQWKKMTLYFSPDSVL